MARALDRDGEAAPARARPGRRPPGRRARPCRHRPASGERVRDVAARRRRRRSRGRAGSTAPAPDDERRGHGRAVRAPVSAAARGSLPGLLAGRRRVPDHAGPFRGRRPHERRPRPVARPVRPHEAPLLPRGRPAGDHRSPALPEGPRRHRDLDDARLRQRRPPQRARALRRGRDHRLPRLRRGRFLFRRRASRRPREAPGARGLRACRRPQGDPGPGREPHRAVSPLGRRSAHADVVPRKRGEARREHLADVDADRSPRHPGGAARHPRRLVHRHPARPRAGGPGRLALSRAERAVVGGHDRARRRPPGHAALRAAPVLGGVERRAPSRVPEADAARRDVRRRSRARVVLPGRRGAGRRRHRHRHAVRLPVLLSAAPRVRARASRCGSWR